MHILRNTAHKNRELIGFGPTIVLLFIFVKMVKNVVFFPRFLATAT